ncbi:hypothetical protein [Vibrio sp. R78045]|uniref:hypothetical protein n=1 Tax=Vibrio sp. R78045 TaxID=3093868 RepID=UPI0036F3B9EC
MKVMSFLSGVTLFAFGIGATLGYQKYQAFQKQEESKIIASYSDFENLIDEMYKSKESSLHYLDLPKEQRCLVEFGWGLNRPILKDGYQRDSLFDSPSEFVSEFYKSIIKTGIEMSFNTYKSKNTEGINWCYGAFQNVSDKDFEHTRNQCVDNLKTGQFGDFNNFNYGSLTTADYFTIFSILNSNYRDQLPLENHQLDSMQKNCTKADLVKS